MKESLTREKGQGLVEYALILVLVAIVVIAVLLLLGPTLRGVFARIVLELQYPGRFGGPPVYMQSCTVTASADCLGGSCSSVRATATVSLRDDGGAPVSAEAFVQFTNNGDGTQKTASGTGSINSGSLGGGSSGSSVQAYIIGVTGYSLVGDSSCGSDTY